MARWRSSHVRAVEAAGGLAYFELVLWDNNIPVTGKNPWQIVSVPSWITTSPAPGVWQFGHSSSDVAVTTQPNPDSQPRTGSIVLCDKTLTVTQAGR